MQTHTLRPRWFSVLALLLAVALPARRTASADDAKAPAAKPAFKQLVVTFEAGPWGPFGRVEKLTIEANGECWYRAESRKATENAQAESGCNINHMLPPASIERLNKLLQATKWLTAPGGAGPATHTDAWTTHLMLDRDGKQTSLDCEGMRPEPYAALLAELGGLALQERRIYLHDWIPGREGTEAWGEIGRELQALRGEPYAKPRYDFEYERYLPTAKRIVRDFYNEPEAELIPAIQLIAFFKAKSELHYLQDMAHDRSSHIRIEVAQALREIHDPESLPVLSGMMDASGTRGEIGFELINWGDAAVPEIVKRIALSADKTLSENEQASGEQMIRAYIDHWQKIKHPVDPRVVVAVQKALAAVPGRTTYHKGFMAKVSAETVPKEKPVEDKPAGN